jgi:hypothetical protein
MTSFGRKLSCMSACRKPGAAMACGSCSTDWLPQQVEVFADMPVPRQQADPDFREFRSEPSEDANDLHCSRFP